MSVDSLETDKFMTQLHTALKKASDQGTRHSSRSVLSSEEEMKHRNCMS